MSEPRASRKSGNGLRVFSRQTSETLASAIAAYRPDQPPTDHALRMAVLKATTEARAQGWQPEELVSALREVVPEEGAPPDVPAEALHAMLKRSAVAAFFGAQMGSF